MESSLLAAAWQALVPADVVVEVMAYSENAQPGGATEEAAALLMSDSRRAEFLTGRECARRALALLGVDAIDLPIAPDRGPQWPAGIVGSITHTCSSAGGWAVAAAAHGARMCALGIDLERCELLDPPAWDIVLTAAERDYLRALALPARLDAASRIWCAKEAALKAARGVTEAADVQIRFSALDGGFRASKHPALNQPGALGWEFEGRCTLIQGYALAVAYQPA